MTVFPTMYQVKQSFPRPVVTDVAAATTAALVTLHLDNKISAGQKIGITVGSRGIQDLSTILRTTALYIQSLGATPYFIAAMGSHGGGTECGQREILESLGLTETALGAPVLTCAECNVIAHTPEGMPVYTLESARQMDGILIVNRVKTHTSFKGRVESGLIKKIVVGLGGPKGAQQFHAFGPSELPRLLIEIGEIILRELPILGGVGIIENAYEETALIRGVESNCMVEQESELLRHSKSLMPALPVDDIDLLIIQEMGKNYSGTGIDTNIIGRTQIQGVQEPQKPCIKRIAVFDLSEESHGNATGLGLADFVTKKIVDTMDRTATYLNCLTSTFVMRAAIPMYFDSEKLLLEAALFSLSGIDPLNLRIVIIPNTLFLSDCLISESLLAEIEAIPRMTISNVPHNLEFDSHGRLLIGSAFRKEADNKSVGSITESEDNPEQTW